MNFVKLEEAGKKMFAKFPKTRRLLKGIYQRLMYFVSSDKTKCEGDITRISPVNDFEYFFGYYDKSPWDSSGRYVISLKVKNAYKVPDSTDEAKIVIIDTESNTEKIIATTHCWNSQQGCMAQWLGPDFSSKIIYNDCRNEKYVSVIYDFKQNKELKVFEMPIYDVAKDGTFALTLDFSRLHRLRKGYGYANLKEATRNEKCPNKACIWKINLISGEVQELVKYTDLKNFETKNNMLKAEHKVNHLMISPNGKRFMVLHRWFNKGEKFTRLVTINTDGTEYYNLSDDNFVSHCCWKNNEEILSFLNKKESGKHYYLMKDKTKEYKMLWPELNTDGHCTYSSDGKFVITDTYPNNKRMASVYLCTENDNKSRKIARVYSPFKYDNDNRCDLHPRWNHNGDEICIDSVHDGKKEIYKISNPLFCNENKTKIPKIIHSVWVGKGKKSKIVKKCEESWKIFAADYKIYEWSEENFDIESAPKYVKDAYAAKKWAFVSDYIRLKVLYEYGGIYMDTDVELFKKMDNLLLNDSFVCIESQYTISTAIIAAKPKSKWIKDLLDEYNDLSFVNDDGSYNLLPNTKRFYKYFKEKFNYNYSLKKRKYLNEVLVLPSCYFSPLNCFTGVKEITNETYGIHHFDNTWKSKSDKIKKKVLQFLTRIFGEKLRYNLSNKR